MDKSKFLLPRYCFATTPKALETRTRPACELSAVLAHGWGVLVFVTDSEQSTGTDWACEILSRTLDKCWKLAQSTKRSWPSVLKVFSDNTPKVSWCFFSQEFLCVFLLVCAVILLRPSTFWALKGLCSKECENSIFGRYLSLLTTCGCFSNTAAEHLTVGHTHEDVGISRMNWQWFPIVFLHFWEFFKIPLRLSIPYLCQWTKMVFSDWWVDWFVKEMIKCASSGSTGWFSSCFHIVYVPVFPKNVFHNFPVTTSSHLRQTPEDILQMLNRKLKNSFGKKQLLFEAEYVTNIRNWADSMPQMTTLAGAFKKRSMDDNKLVPHSFAYVRRDAMPQNLQEEVSNRMPRRFAASPSDVFLLVKAFVSDTRLCQPPLLVWPGQEVSQAQESLRQIASNRVPGVAVYLDDDRKTTLMEIASYLEKNYTGYGRGILYLRQLAGTVAKPRVPAPSLQFLLQGPCVGRYLDQIESLMFLLMRVEGHPN